MKKYLNFLFLLVPLNSIALPRQGAQSLYSQLTFAYNSGFYPGAMQFAERIQEEYPDSFFIGEALLVKGECQVRLGLEAEETLAEAVRLNASDRTKLSASYYWLSRSYELSGAKHKALENYLECMKVGAGKYFYPSILNAANVFVKLEDFENAIPLYEAVLENGNEFSLDQYADALLNLCRSYNRSGKASRTIDLREKFSGEDFSKLALPDSVHLALESLSGEAYELSGEYKKAYELYCKVLESGEKNLAADALKRAYLVSSSHRKEVGAEPGTVLSNAQKTLAENPELLGEFWTRLGTDAYGDGDLKKSLAYFDEAEKNVPVDLFLYALLYRAQIAAGVNPDEKSAAQAEKMILESRGILNKENEAVWDRESYILLSRYAAMQKKWEDVKTYGAKVNPLDEDTRFFLALANYCTGDYRTSLSLLKNHNIELQALCYARSGDLKNSAFVYANIQETRPLSDEERLNYAKVLLLSGRYREAQIESAKVKNPEGKYILGLSQFNTWSWPYAEENFREFVKNPGNSAKNYVSYATFYLGYSQYRQGKSKEAYENLNAFVSRFPEHELYYNGQIAAANSAVQNLRYEQAERHARAAVKSAAGDEQTEEAVLLCAEVLSDASKYSDAILLLSRHVLRNDSFGMKSAYQTAQIYERQKDFERADFTYRSIYERFPEEKLADEAMYRRGELYYNAKNFEMSVKCFDEYTRSYPLGSYIDAARYFSAESLSNGGNTERAILQYQQLIQRYPASTYVYSSAKNLVFLYRAKAEYEKALEYTTFLSEKYGSQAKNDGIQKLASDLKNLSSGKTEEMVQKENEYRSSGALGSAAGRKIGTELVSVYAASQNYQEPAVSLAESLLQVQKKNIDKEFPYAARNAEFLGKKYREGEKNRESAQKYLDAAEYYKMSALDDRAAASLYGAYEAFRAAGLFADANETAKLLRELYPESRQARSVKIQ